MAADDGYHMKDKELHKWIAICNQSGKFIADDDGRVFYWPRGARGALDSTALRALADHLEKQETKKAMQSVR